MATACSEELAGVRRREGTLNALKEQHAIAEAGLQCQVLAQEGVSSSHPGPPQIVAKDQELDEIKATCEVPLFSPPPPPR